MKSILGRYFYLTLGVIFMINIFGCSGMKFEKYSSKDPMINLTMDYISGWKYSETRGSYGSYAQVMFYQFKEGEKGSRGFIEAIVNDSSKMHLPTLTLQAVSDDLLARRMTFREAKVLSKSMMRILDTDAVVIELTYLVPENLLNVNSKLISVKEKIVIFKKGKDFYFVKYENRLEEFDKYSSAFAHIVKSLKIKEDK